MGGLTVLSNIIGWLYFFFWGISFYGQIYENWKCKRDGVRLRGSEPDWVPVPVDVQHGGLLRQGQRGGPGGRPGPGVRVQRSVCNSAYNIADLHLPARQQRGAEVEHRVPDLPVGVRHHLRADHAGLRVVRPASQVHAVRHAGLREAAAVLRQVPPAGVLELRAQEHRGVEHLQHHLRLPRRLALLPPDHHRQHRQRQLLRVRRRPQHRQVHAQPHRHGLRHHLPRPALHPLQPQQEAEEDDYDQNISIQKQDPANPKPNQTSDQDTQHQIA